jgi:hypothetical protein
MSKIKTIGILTSGGDAPGMNAAIRAVTRAAIYNELNIKGIYRGYDGLIKGEVKTFTTGPNTTGIEVVRDADSETKAVDDKVKGIYTLTGVKLSDDAADLKMLKRGIYIVNGRKVAVK